MTTLAPLPPQQLNDEANDENVRFFTEFLDSEVKYPF